ncbi:hypothetical protein Hbl1158_06540 [Halobaculum sp. CBA1158]|uniref:hypothetical protein n=1 Tax=Halobaculum sp. CBA1158 TaxID=2904243 RepID=UPI001F4833F1|nr:hypothetical protein [Halobaculum sp. CBA1158]UIP01006.1 hypothetical protein Hbl1158_06540 [Halobaculum sp. CBA1158]
MLNLQTALLTAENLEEKIRPASCLAYKIDPGQTQIARLDLMFVVSDSPNNENDGRVIHDMMIEV